jgi:N-acyl-D-aspartate/D-glutamate deacylase
LGLPVAERARALADPTMRPVLVDAIAEYQRATPWALLEFDRMTVENVSSPGLKSLEGRVVGDIAREQGISAVDALLDVAVHDQLLTTFKTVSAGDDDASWRQRAEYWQHPRVLVGGSDAGAHLDSLATFAFYTDFVGPTVRDRGLLTLEDAVHKVTDLPARLYGLRGRGRLEPGYVADVVVFDPATVGTGDVVLRQDLPNDEHRLFADSRGVDHVLVNGVEILDHGTFTGATPGTVLRLGRD